MRALAAGLLCLTLAGRPAVATNGTAANGSVANGAAAPVWVFLQAKRDVAGERHDWPEPADLSSTAALDLPLDEAAVSRVAATGARVRLRSRWFNAVSVEVTPAQQAQLRRLPGVREVRPVATWHRPTPPEGEIAVAFRAAAAADYGPSLAQAAAVGVPLLHERGIYGQGIRIAIIDAGYNWRDQAALTELDVVAERDFINGDDDVSDEADEPITGNEGSTGQNQHGTRVLSVLAGWDPGELLGVAPRAEYLLAKTDDVTPVGGDERESPLEEDRWVAALEWADSLGAQVVNSSLGYTEFDDGSGYVYEDLDGATALTTKAAQLAVERGIVVVAAAGNEGSGAWHYITVPADAPGVIAVGAVHPVSSALAYFSSRGPTADGRIKPDVVAPGQQIYLVNGRAATAAEGRDVFALHEYTSAPGTSFASPIVAGACALLLQVHPEWTPDQVADALRGTATDLGAPELAGPDTLFGWGLINVARASGLDVGLPDSSVVGAPFPNPASEVVHFPVELATAASVRLSLFDAAGSLIERLPVQRLPPGAYVEPGLAPRWQVPADLASGVYFYRIEAEGFQRSGKVAVVRGS